jgi:hypothetical protein
MEPIERSNQREIDVIHFYLRSISNLTDKMVPADYLYLSDRVSDFQERIDEIKKR